MADEYSEYSGDERRITHWHVEKNISVGHILTTVSMILAAMVFAFQMDTRVSVLESENLHSKEERIRIEQHTDLTFIRIEDYLIRIEKKVDEAK